MKKLVRTLRLTKAFLALVQNPAKTDRVFALSDILRDQKKSPLFRSTVKYVTELEGVPELFASAYNPPLPSLQELKKYPDGTLGREFARHMLSHGLEVDFYPHLEGTEAFEFVLERSRKSHDLWHVLTGFDTSVAGEIGLQAFGLAQMRAAFPALLIAGGILHALVKDQSIYESMIDNIFYGYQMGKNAKILIGVKLEEKLHVNLESLRQELRLPTRAVVTSVVISPVAMNC